VTTGTADQSGNHIWIERGSAGRDPAHGIGKHAQIADLLFEQIANTLRAAGHQVKGVPILKELREAPTSGCVARISSAARSPSSVWSGGICMSVTTTSGRYVRTLRTNSRASPAVDTTSNPPSWRM